MHIASIRNDLEIIKYFLKHKATANIENNLGNSPLLEAASFASVDCVKELLKATTNAKYRKGWFHMSVSNPDYRVFELAVKEHGEDICAEPFHKDPFWLPIMIATANNADPKVVEFILNHGGKTEIENSEGETPLSYAVKLKQKETIKLLLKAGAQKDRPNKHGITPVHIAQALDDFTIKNLLA